ncbi:hypothetical protein HW555_013941 [Spodoptera exigua]|uniref:Uncharacterized protein n=1 Tax=Spodoptera exigua TaxID=7107 RepID=A0A835KY55_SPOEX|nr:hypothetical protein HW555_013941 [Spodoptera exigua]
MLAGENITNTHKYECCGPHGDVATDDGELCLALLQLQFIYGALQLDTHSRGHQLGAIELFTSDRVTHCPGSLLLNAVLLNGMGSSALLPLDGYRLSKKTNTDSDIFGISKNRNIINKEHSLDHLTSFIVNRVASGCERRATTTDGEFYIECKVYKAEDARLTDSAELWKKALIRMKFQTDVDSLQWRKLQELVQATDILFPDKPMIYDN